MTKAIVQSPNKFSDRTMYRSKLSACVETFLYVKDMIALAFIYLHDRLKPVKGSPSIPSSSQKQLIFNQIVSFNRDRSQRLAA